MSKHRQRGCTRKIPMIGVYRSECPTLCHYTERHPAKYAHYQDRTHGRCTDPLVCSNTGHATILTTNIDECCTTSLYHIQSINQSIIYSFNKKNRRMHSLVKLLRTNYIRVMRLSISIRVAFELSICTNCQMGCTISKSRRLQLNPNINLNPDPKPNPEPNRSRYQN